MSFNQEIRDNSIADDEMDIEEPESPQHSPELLQTSVDVIPGTPQPTTSLLKGTRSVRKRKLVSKTMLDEEGFLGMNRHVSFLLICFAVNEVFYLQ